MQQTKHKEIIAYVKFWFGSKEDIFKEGLIVKYSDDKRYASIYKET